jgi:ribonuclease HI
MDYKNINVYTDGACSNNGRASAKAGIGIFFSENDSRNFYARIEGKQTNNTAEINAILKVADILKREILAGFTVNIYSDSEYAMRCCREYGEKLEKINWEKNKPIPNVEIVKEAYYTFKDCPNVLFHYIAAHTGLNDTHSIGNEGADKLANLAIGQTECNSRPKKLYVKIPYDEKEHGKRLGAKWDPKKKKWYIPPNLDIKSKETILNKWPK